MCVDTRLHLLNHCVHHVEYAPIRFYQVLASRYALQVQGQYSVAHATGPSKN